MKKHYYAVKYPYGFIGHASTGKLIRDIYRFKTDAERLAWIARGVDYKTNPDYRAAVTRREVEAEIKRGERKAVEYYGGDAWKEDSLAGGEMLFS